MYNEPMDETVSINTNLFISTRQVNVNPITSSCVGIFWLSNDSSKITDITGLQKFTGNDLHNKSFIQPQGGHHLYTFPRDQPRGRLEVGGGFIKVYLGEDFPRELESSIKDQIINWFRLDEYKNLIKFVYHYHWNTKDRVSHEQIRKRD